MSLLTHLLHCPEYAIIFHQLLNVKSVIGAQRFRCLRKGDKSDTFYILFSSPFSLSNRQASSCRTKRDIPFLYSQAKIVLTKGDKGNSFLLVFCCYFFPFVLVKLILPSCRTERHLILLLTGII